MTALRAWLALGAVLAAIGLFLFLRHLQAENRRLSDDVAAGQSQGRVTAAAGQITERTIVREATIHDKAEADADAVQTAPGAAAPIAPDVLGAWRRGVLAQRGDPAGAGAGDAQR